MNLGTFSLSLKVKSIEESIDFYSKLGFKIIDGGHQNEVFPDTAQMKWRILQHESLKIGLFQGMFEQNILTFHPNNVLEIQQKLKIEGITFVKEAVENSTEENSAILTDPDGNQIMLEQM